MRHSFVSHRREISCLVEQEGLERPFRQLYS
jgi:hypothetical protein